MTRDDIYDHLAQVYLGKRKEVDQKKKQQFNAWLVINIVTTLVIFASVFYGLTAFLTQHGSFLQSNVILSLHNGPLRLEYDFEDPLKPAKSFDLSVSPVDASRYKKIQFSIRGKEQGSPGIIKVVFRNKKNEIAYYYVQGVDTKWQKFSIPLDEFRQISDWTNLTDVSFEVESWNVNNKKGIVLIDDVRFSS